jgi:F-type H+-transporting ATPase subunit O
MNFELEKRTPRRKDRPRMCRHGGPSSLKCVLYLYLTRRNSVFLFLTDSSNRKQETDTFTMLGLSRASLHSRSIQTAVVRSFSEASHRPPLQLAGIQARYANATYVAASKAGKLEQVEQEIGGLHKTAQTSKPFAQFLENPLISRNEKTAYVESLDKLSPITRNLLVTMAGNARLNELPKVASVFAQLMKAKRGEVDAKIISAEPLSASQLKEVQAAMASQVPTGKKVILETVTDPSIVGGLQVQIGDQFLDLSVKSRIEEISRMPLT